MTDEPNGAEHPVVTTAFGLFAAQVVRTPKARAYVGADGTTLDYAGLHGLAIALAEAIKGADNDRQS